MATTMVECRRCGRTADSLARPPMPGPLGAEIQSGVCADCWREWEAAEVMVINELRLNFMDPEAQRVLAQHMREFLSLDPPAAG
jgi:Fe-S cluster biosynthesis and repair protein YggX